MNPSFADLGVPPTMVASLSARGIEAPFPIQALTLADTLAGRDVSGKAPTGSGKTLAFGIPLVIGCPTADPRRPHRLVLVPTRELASQVTDELRLLVGRRGPRVEAFFGGVPIARNDRALQRGVDIAVACPGRLADLIEQRMVRLDDVGVVVLDEADRMADMGFLPQVRRLIDACRDDRQTVLFSATLDGDVDVLVRTYQRDPVRHELEVPVEELPDLEHHFWGVERTERVAVAARIVDRMGPTVVFCRTKRGADRVARQLGSAGVSAAAIHGDRSQNQRDRALEDFRSGRATALVATDVAARGIHVDDVAAVIHFDPPEDPKDYVHRSGRTARAGARGVVVSLVAPEKRSLVKGLQKALDLPRSLTDVDLDSLGEPPQRIEGRRQERPRPAAPSRDRNGTRTDDRGRDRSRGEPGAGEGARPSEDAESPRRRRHRRRHEGDGRRSTPPVPNRKPRTPKQSKQRPSANPSAKASTGSSGRRDDASGDVAARSGQKKSSTRPGTRAPKRPGSRPSSRGPRR